MPATMTTTYASLTKTAVETMPANAAGIVTRRYFVAKNDMTTIGPAKAAIEAHHKALGEKCAVMFAMDLKPGHLVVVLW